MRSILATSLIATALLTGCSSTEEVQPSDRIRIGGLWSLTGPGAELDIPSRNGAELALKETNVQGVLGKQLELVNFDAHRDSAAAANDVLNAGSGIVGFIGLSDADPAIGAGIAATSRNLPFITSGATYPKLLEIAGKSTFLACFGDNVQAAAAAEFANDSLNKRRAFILYNNSTTYTTALKGYFRTRWLELGCEIAGEAAYDLGTTNFSAQLAAIDASGADVIFFSAVPDDIVGFIRSLRFTGNTLPMIGGDGLDAPIITDSLEASESNNVYFTTHTHVSAGTSPAMANFIDNYTAEYGTEPPSAFAALGYDAMKLMAQAIGKAGSTDNEALFDAIESITNYPGLTGMISFSAENHIPRKSVTVIRLVNREYQRAAEFVPRSIPAP